MITKLVPFAGAHIETAVDASGLYVNIARVCEHLGLDTRAQVDALRERVWAHVRVIATPSGPCPFLDARALPMWVATIDEALLTPSCVWVLRAYQCRADYEIGARPEPERTRPLARVHDDHEARIRALESRTPAVRRAAVRLMRTRWNARFREETGELTRGMDPASRSDWYLAVNGDLKRAFGRRDNWHVAKFIEAARWLKRNYGIDITDIAEPT